MFRRPWRERPRRFAAWLRGLFTREKRSDERELSGEYRLESPQAAAALTVPRTSFDDLDAPVLRVHQADVPMPYAKNLEKAAKPDAAKTIAAIRKVMYLD